MTSAAVALRDLGEAAWTARDLFADLVDPGVPRGDRAAAYAHVCDLRAIGLSKREIAAATGYSISYVRDLFTDPTGDKSRARKERYCGECVDCGAATSGGDGREKAPLRCATCAATFLHDTRYWTLERIVAAFLIAEEILGRQPTASDFNRPFTRSKCSPERIEETEALHEEAERRGVFLPAMSVIAYECGGFGALLEHLGRDRSPTGHPSHRESRDNSDLDWSKARILASLAWIENDLGRAFVTGDLLNPESISTRAKINVDRVAELVELRARAAAAGHVIPSSSTVFSHFGSIGEARAALAEVSPPPAPHPMPRRAPRAPYAPRVPRARRAPADAPAQPRLYPSSARTRIEELAARLGGLNARRPADAEFVALVERELAEAGVRAREALLTASLHGGGVMTT